MPGFAVPRRTLTTALTVLGLLAAGAAVQATGAATPAHAATTYRVLFDDGHAEEAGNADWIISTSKPDPLAQDSSPSLDKDWTGALSSWGVALQKTGSYSLKTATSALTYGGSSTTDLSKFDALVLPEPNTLFTTAEKTAIMNFVKNGGGLFMISDHTGADRNNDGYDAVEILNDLMTNNSV
ncbi:hydrolase, partial [Streptomyces sp900105755]